MTGQRESFTAWRRAPFACVEARRLLQRRRVRAAVGGLRTAASGAGIEPDRVVVVRAVPGPALRSRRAAAIRSAFSSVAVCRATVASRRLTRDSASSNTSARSKLRRFFGRAKPRPPIVRPARWPAPVLPDVLVAGPPDPAVQVQQPVLVERFHPVALGLADQRLFCDRERVHQRVHASTVRLQTRGMAEFAHITGVADGPGGLVPVHSRQAGCRSGSAC